MKILVTGAGGGLGGEIPHAFTDDELILLTRKTLDVTDGAAVTQAITDSKPDAVIHAAAYTAVDAAEEHEALAKRVNVDGTRNVAAAANKAGATLIYPSTDYVFDGEKPTPYEETDKPNPLSVYGLAKLEGERVAAEANPRTYVVRTSWLYSQTGKSFATTMLKLFEERDELSVVADEVSSPTYARDFARGLKNLLATSPEPGTYHLSGGGETSWLDYAREIARLAGSGVTLKATTAATWDAPAQRPAHSTLDNAKAWQSGIKLPDWKESLAAFFADRA